MSGGSHDRIHDHAGSLAELAARPDTLETAATRLLELGVDRAGRDTRELVRSLGQWQAAATERAGRLALVWRALDLHDSGDITADAVRAAGDVYATGLLPPARRAVEDPAGYLRDALDAHERSEHARRTLHPDAPELHLSSERAGWLTEGGLPLTAEWWEWHSDPAADPFVLAGISIMRSVLDDFARDTDLLKSLEPDGEAYGMTVRAAAVRMELIQAWAAVYAERAGA
ncbi:hypothetical protein WB388_40230 [Streptomyces brasiliscabiei]|uniref:Uncharacterized protein n=1 Tax=Streptomyces brasiliscabiei TaxID=2736302 RepID=A0ABU8GPX0_9ACTN